MEASGERLWGRGVGEGLTHAIMGRNSHMFLPNTCTVQKPPRVLALLFQYEWRDEFHKIIHISMKTAFQESLNIPFTVEGNKAFRENKTKQKPSVSKGRVNSGTAMRKEFF